MFKRFMDSIRSFFAALVSMICEKDEDKSSTLDIPFVISATRSAIIAGVIMFWIVGVSNAELFTAWPFATLGIILHFALPITHALKRADPEKIIEYAKSIADRIGQG